MNKKIIALVLTCLTTYTVNLKKIAEDLNLDPKIKTRRLQVPSYPKTTKHISQTNLSSSATNMYTIQQSGRYYIDSNLYALPGGANRRVIKITANNVVLDLNGMVISQAHTNTQSGLNAVDIASGVSNVTIMNGFINDVTDVGINVDTNCNNIRLLNLGISNCNGGGLQFNTVTNIYMENVSVTKCNGQGTSRPSSSAVGLYMTSCSSVQIESCNFDYNVAPGSTNSYGGLVSACTNVKINNSSFSSNTGNSGRGLVCSSNCKGFLVTNSLFNCNNGDTDYTDGIGISTCQAFKFKNCKFSYNTSVQSSSAAYINGCSGFVFEDCEANYTSTSNGEAVGLNIIGGRGHIIKNCKVLGNRGTSAAGSGIRLQSSTTGIIVDSCTCANNTTTTSGTAYGINVSSGTTNCKITNNTLLYNVGAGSNNFGYYDGTAAGTGTTTMLGGNVSFGHGTVGTLNDTANLSNTTGNYYFQLAGTIDSSNSPARMIQEIKIGQLAESGTGRVTTAGYIGKFGTFDNLSLIQ